MGETDLIVTSFAHGVKQNKQQQQQQQQQTLGETDLLVASLADGVGTPPMGETDPIITRWERLIL